MARLRSYRTLATRLWDDREEHRALLAGAAALDALASDRQGRRRVTDAGLRAAAALRRDAGVLREIADTYEVPA